MRTTTICVGCGTHLDPAVIMEKQFYSGFVKDGATFVITDDLKVMPNSMDITSFIMVQNGNTKHKFSKGNECQCHKGKSFLFTIVPYQSFISSLTNTT